MFEIFVIHSKDPKLKEFFLIFQIVSRCSDTRVQSYPTSARKIFGVEDKRRVPAEKMLLWEHGKAKRLIEKMGTSYFKREP